MKVPVSIAHRFVRFPGVSRQVRSLRNGAFCTLLLLTLFAVEAQPKQNRLRLMAWNVENLFDTVHDAGFHDEEFLPQATRHWNSYRYWQKLTEIARVVAAVADQGGVPDLVALCEVENHSVLTTLTRRSILRSLNYRYTMTSGIDKRGINVALLYQPNRFRVLESRSIRIPCEEQGMKPTRDILHVRGIVPTAEGTDTLHVFVVHLPSRLGGFEADRKRKLAARVLWDAVDSLQGERVIVAGDFNTGSDDAMLHHPPMVLTDDAHMPGTYCFQGCWQWLDHILVSPAIGMQSKARPVELPWLLEENNTYGGWQPRRTYNGPSYHGGVSDHLPLVLDFML